MPREVTPHIQGALTAWPESAQSYFFGPGTSGVLAVVSTKAAYLMNGGAGTNETHPPIAMTGRVPVNVMGFVTKGDRLVSAGNGVARSANLDELTSFNVIGRALESKTDEGLGSIEAIVKIA